MSMPSMLIGDGLGIRLLCGLSIFTVKHVKLTLVCNAYYLIISFILPITKPKTNAKKKCEIK